MKNSLLFLLALSSISLLNHPHAAASAAKKRPYIVYLGGHSHGPEATLEDYERATESHYALLGSFLGSEGKARSAIFYSYQKNINGFAAMLDEEEALQIAKHPDVTSVFPSTKMKLHTTRSWHDLGLEKDGKVFPASIWSKAKFGEDIIIGNLDTGVWPESKSFSDQGMGPVPSRWKGRCQNDTRRGVPCNRKLIGARYFRLGPHEDDAEEGETVLSARDFEGHGTHTLSTAAGRFVPGVSIYGQANGTAKGGSPSARVAAYKVCWPGKDCTSADILAGFETAIHDGVDVLSVSLGGEATDYLRDSIAVGAFHAVQRGITVVCSAGNSGPYQGWVSNVAPWIITVAASTMDRSFPSLLFLGNKKQIKGESVASAGLPANKLYPLIYARDAKDPNTPAVDASLCKMGALDPEKAKGKIVICMRGENARMAKGVAVQAAGATGMVLINDKESGNNLVADPHVLPATMITYEDGITLRSYMNSTNPVGHISKPKTEVGVKPNPRMAAFSSVGPNLITPQILKPDITAPGVSILAAFTEGNSPSELPEDKRRAPFILMSGTSMSCPHVAGIVGLIKKMHPDWSPAAIRSAMMTTARTRDNTGKAMQGAFGEKAIPFQYGAGHVRPNRAMDPGLVYDLKASDYRDFLCAIGYRAHELPRLTGKLYKCPAKPPKVEDLNYPSITVPDLSGSMTVTRTLTNVGAPGTYRVRVRPPFGITVAVNPEVLQFHKAGEEKSFRLTLRAREESVGRGYLFGEVTWSDGKHRVRSPLTVNVFKSPH